MSSESTSKKRVRRPIQALGGLIRERRGKRTIRQVAAEIGISSATLLRVETGRTPDVETFGKVCRWLQLDPRTFLGSSPADEQAQDLAPPEAMQFSAHFRADREPIPATLAALARMLLLAAQSQRRTERPDPDASPEGI